MNRLEIGPWGRIAGMFRGAGRLLSFQGTACLSCRQAQGDSGNPLGLCAACYASIPWITEVRCSICGRYEECPDCGRRRQRHYICSRSAVRYDPVMKEMLARYKYRGDEALAKLLGGMMIHAYSLLLKSGQLPDGRADGITFVPVNPERLEDRGFNQAEQLANELGKRTGIPVFPMLVRTRNTPKQSFKTRGERLLDLKGAFAATKSGIEMAASLGSSGRPVRLLLVDDVYTTGSTLNQCASSIMASLEVQVYGLTWAR